MPPTPSVSLRWLKGRRATRCLLDAGLLLAAMLLAGAASVLLLRQDVNWDLQNYHFYNAWAFVHGRLGWDLAPAQVQTFHNPLLDLPFYWMVAADWPPRLISFAMALPAGVGAFFLAKILLLSFADLPGRQRWGYPILAFAVGVTASGPVSLLGSTMNDWPGTALVMVALWLLLQRSERRGAHWPAVAAAGCIVGIASGLKLTTATYAVGLCVALLAQPPILARGLRDAVAFAVAVVAGLSLSSGAWMWTLYTHFESPLFPYFNDILGSPWWDATRLVDPRFGPRTLAGWLTFPLPLLQFSSGYVTELFFRDWRLPLIYLASIGALAAWLVRRVRRRTRPHAVSADSADKWRLVLVFWGASLVVWAAMHAVYRYMMPLELLSGAVLFYLLRLSVPRRWVPTAAAITAALAILTVRYPDWGRIDYGEHYFVVTVPPVAPRAAILLLSDQAMAFVLPYLPPDGRFLGADNSFNNPRYHNRLETEVARTVREHGGPLYSLAPSDGVASAALSAHGLRRIPGGCASIVSNMSPLPLELCLLDRIRSPAQPPPSVVM